MKDHVSIVFAALLAVFLIVVLPLFSILDRQDSMSYNVVLTETTKFVDNIRNNGFIDKESYYNYISALSATANMYKVEIEVYRKRLIKNTSDGSGKVYKEELELFNTMDVLEVLEGSENVANIDKSNEKNNVYLLQQNDEIYLKVYNTNITTGSVIYKAFSKEAQDKVIDISYGGIVNNVNWELFNQINAGVLDIPEVLLEVPVNASNKINIMRVTEYGDLEEIDCNNAAYAGLCEDGIPLYQQDSYTYLYDLTYKENKEMTIAVELKNMDYIVVGENADGSLKYAELATLTQQQFNNAKSYIKNNFIQLNEMIANVDLKYRGKQEYYMFDIVLTDIEIASVDLISLLGSVSVLPGLGKDLAGTISMGAETVKVELLDESSIHTVKISDPINWPKLLKTGSVTNSLMTSGEVYKDLEIAFIVSYTGLTNKVDEIGVRQAIEEKLRIEGDTAYKNLEVMTTEELKTKYNLNITTRTIGHVLVKFVYTQTDEQKDNYVSLESGWIKTNIYDDEEQYEDEDYDPNFDLAYGADSSKYAVLVDDSAPVTPKLLIDGIVGNNGWYIKDNILLTVPETTTDTIKRNGITKNGGSGVQKNTLFLTGKSNLSEREITQYIIGNEGITYATVYAYDYLNNSSNTGIITIKLDKTAPTTPKVQISGTIGKQNWYTSDVILTVTPGTDNVSGVAKTTYAIKGAQNITEKDLPKSGIINLTKDGYNQVIITTYDNAGNYSEKVLQVYIDRTKPAGVDFKVTKGSKNLNGWYNTEVGIKISAKDNISPSGADKIVYEIIGTEGATSVAKTTMSDLSQEIILSNSGRYTIKTYSYNKAGNVLVQEYKVAIDKDAPNNPTISLYSPKATVNGWYTDYVDVTFTSNKDIGPSTEQSLYYSYTKNGITSKRFEISSPSKITIKDDGVYTYNVYSLDYASNESSSSKEIKIDTIAPVSAEFVIDGTKGLNGWYLSDVNISYKGGSDEGSGIESIVLSKEKVTEKESGTTVTIKTIDKAGHVTTSSKIIEIDSVAPTAPTIKLPSVTGSGVDNVSLYNKDISITLTPGTDKNLDKTTYKIVNSETGDIVVSETISTTVSMTNSGKYKLVATTYDKAGNSSNSSKEIWINKNKPVSPKIAYINSKKITNNATQTVTGPTKTLKVQLADVEVGSVIKLKVLEDETYQTKEVEVKATSSTPTVTITLDAKGEYWITATQTNMYGTTSNVSSGSYKYIYE